MTSLLSGAFVAGLPLRHSVAFWLRGLRHPRRRKFVNELERGMFGDQIFSQCTANQRA